MELPKSNSFLDGIRGHYPFTNEVLAGPQIEPINVDGISYSLSKIQQEADDLQELTNTLENNLRSTNLLLAECISCSSVVLASTGSVTSEKPKSTIITNLLKKIADTMNYISNIVFYLNQ